MGIVCPLMNLERQDVTSDMNLNHRHAYLHHANLQTRKFNKPHRTLIHNNNVNNCVSTYTKKVIENALSHY